MRTSLTPPRTTSKTKTPAPPTGKAQTPTRKKRHTQADVLRSTREAHSRETAEDYVEAIAELTAQTGEARVTDLAKKFGVSHVTVNRTVTRLQKHGYVTSLPYRSIFLTEKGKATAAESKRRHEIVLQFLRLQGVPEEAALHDAEGIEHHVSAETLAVFEKALQNN